MLLQAISWENCLVNIIMQTNPGKKREVEDSLGREI